MKIQCACGAKFAFDVTPAMVQEPVRFVCPSCGLDSSEMVNRLIREQHAPAATATPAAPPIEIAPPPDGVSTLQPEAAGIAPPPPSPASAPPPLVPAAPTAPPPPPPHTASPRPQMRISRAAPASTAAAGPVAGGVMPMCSRHAGKRTVERCVVCEKPICPECMSFFGYVCSPHCRQKAENQGIEVPVYAGQKSLVERKRWRKVGLVSGGIGAVVAGLLGFWFWYAWFGSMPGPVYSVRFEQSASSGQCRRVGKDHLVFIHGSTLALHDLNKEKEVWSVSLVDRGVIQAQATAEMKELVAARRRAELEGENLKFYPVPEFDKLVASVEQNYVRGLKLHVRDQNIWVAYADKMVRHDWSTGKAAQEVEVEFGWADPVEKGDELVMLRDDYSGQQTITRVNLKTGDVSKQEFGGPRKNPFDSPTVLAAADAARTGKQALDPLRVAADVNRMPIDQRLALPATLSVQRNQDRLMAEMEEMDTDFVTVETGDGPMMLDKREHSTLFLAEPGPVQFSSQLVKENIVARTAMKPKPGKSALDGPVSVTATADIANEILNEIQRDRGGAVVYEDESTYRVKVKLPGTDASEWSAEVSGKPSFEPLETVNLVIGGKTVIALDKQNKKLWESKLNYTVGKGGDDFFDLETTGSGTIAERDGVVFVTDQGVLTAFDAKTGNVNWRYPSVGITGLFFDEKGMVYINTTTADPDSIKYSRQIDVTKSVNSLVVKLNPKDGTTMWKLTAEGAITHVSGKFIYTLTTYSPLEDDEEDTSLQVGYEGKGYIRIKRISAKNGKVLWDYRQDRTPLDVEFQDNNIYVVFKKEVQVLKFMSL